MSDPNKWTAALQAYHAERAAMLAAELLPALGDESMSAALSRMRAAEWELVKTRAVRPHDIRERAAVVEIMMHDAEHFGEPTDGVHFAMLAALRIDLDRVEWTEAPAGRHHGAPYGRAPMKQCDAERLFQRIDRLNEQLEDVRQEFEFDDNPEAAKIADHLARASEALGPAEWAIRSAYRLPELAD
jgi:hypothetical protein